MKVKAIINFNDLEENKHRVVGDVFECSKERCDYLLEHKAIEVLEYPDVTETEIEVRSEEVKKLVNEKVENLKKNKKKKSKK